jgi:prepilin-type processing-associated H-X9-DG protein
MVAIADSRVILKLPQGIPLYSWFDWLYCGLAPGDKSPYEVTSPRHPGGVNVVFCDGHVVVMSRQVLFDYRKSASSWNNDHQPHPEFWYMDASLSLSDIDVIKCPNNLLETNRRPASPLGAGQQFRRAVYAQSCVFDGGRSAKRWTIRR